MSFYSRPFYSRPFYPGSRFCPFVLTLCCLTFVVWTYVVWPYVVFPFFVWPYVVWPYVVWPYVVWPYVVWPYVVWTYGIYICEGSLLIPLRNCKFFLQLKLFGFWYKYIPYNLSTNFQNMHKTLIESCIFKLQIFILAFYKFIKSFILF